MMGCICMCSRCRRHYRSSTCQRTFRLLSLLGPSLNYSSCLSCPIASLDVELAAEHLSCSVGCLGTWADSDGFLWYPEHGWNAITVAVALKAVFVLRFSFCPDHAIVRHVSMMCSGARFQSSSCRTLCMMRSENIVWAEPCPVVAFVQVGEQVCCH